MAQNIYHHSKREEREQRKEVLDEKPAGQTSNSSLPHLTSKCCPHFQLLSASLAVANFFSLGWFHSLMAGVYGRYLIALASPTFWNMQGNRASPSTLDTMTHLPLNVRTPLARAWPQ